MTYTLLCIYAFNLLFHYLDKLDKLRSCFGQVIEGYGMTETACVISALDKDDISIGHVGAPSPACGWLHFWFYVVFLFTYLTSISYLYNYNLLVTLSIILMIVILNTLLSYIVHVDIFSLDKEERI